MRVVEEFDAETGRSGEAALHDGKHSCNIRVGLLKGHTGLETGKSLLAEIAKSYLVAIPLEGHDHRGIGLVEEVKVGGHDADNLTWFPVEEDGLAQNGWRAGEFFVPEAVGDYDGVGGAGRIVLSGKGTT